MIKVVQVNERPTHRVLSPSGGYIYLVANGVIEVAHACVCGIEDVQYKNAEGLFPEWVNAT